MGPVDTSAAEPESATIGPSEGSSEGEEGSEDEEGSDEDEEEEEEEEESEEGEGTPGAAQGSAAAAAPRKPADARQGMIRFLLFFLGFLGLFMLIDPTCWSNPPSSTCSRIEVANALGYLLAPALGFNGYHILLTMFLAAAIEMGASALAYHATTDWIETARVAKHGQAIRPLWMKALRSGKKDRVAALKPHMDSLNARQSRVTINQFKGMVITWVLLIAIYTWVGLYITSQCPALTLNTPNTVAAGSPVTFSGSVGSGHAPYEFFWWAQLSPNGAVTGPVNTANLSWTYTPGVGGLYIITLEVVDSRGNDVVRNVGLSVGSSSALPSPSAAASSPSASGASPAQAAASPPGTTGSGCQGSTVDFFGATGNLLATVGPFPLWFLTFSLYTFPCNLIFRRYLKHTALASHLQTLPPGGPAEGSAGGQTIT